MTNQTDAGGPLIVDEPAFFNPFEDGFFENPYPQYARLREREPRHRSPLGPVFLFCYDDIRRVLRASNTSMDPSNTTLPLISDEINGIMKHGLIKKDAPVHTRLRRLVSNAFTPRVAKASEARLQAIADRLLDDLEARYRDTGGPVDLLAGYALALPLIAISEILGMPEGDRPQVGEWTRTITKAVDPIMTPAEVAAAVDAGGQMLKYLAEEVLPWKRAHPQQDILTHLLQGEDGDQLTEEELLDQVMLIYIAGYETTVNLIGNGLWHLMRNRAQYDRLLADPELITNAVEELNRFDAPAQLAWRIPLVDFHLDDLVVEAGSIIIGMVGSANRDPKQFGADADVLDLGRKNANTSLSFGGGAHHCLGAALARVEGPVAIGTVVRRFPQLALASDSPGWTSRIALRGLLSLPVTLD